MNINILTYDSIDSTNTEALKQARMGADEGLCIVARQQTAGRGRYGRVWISEKDAGLYFSIVLRPSFEAQYLSLITLMAGVAVHDALSELGIDADIKWVNDLLVREKKICGILAETTETSLGLAVVVGIGINLKSSNFPPELVGTATSIEEECMAGGAAGGVDTDELAEKLNRYLSYFYSVLTAPGGPAAIIDEWRQRSSYYRGKRVTVNLENKTISGVTDGLEPNGALRIMRDDGGIATVHAGEVERVRATSGNA